MVLSLFVEKIRGFQSWKNGGFYWPVSIFQKSDNFKIFYHRLQIRGKANK